MHLDIEIPSFLPIMTLSKTVFFPQSILPLHIFEERYKRMLSDILATDRLFAVACQDDEEVADDDHEMPCTMATVGVIRAAHENADGTSNLVVQGVCRVKILSFTDTAPYPTIQAEPQKTDIGSDPVEIQLLKTEISHLLNTESNLTNGVPDEFMEFLASLDDPEAFIDLTTFATCQCCRTKQRILETLALDQRYRTFLGYLTRRRDQFQLDRRLQGDMDDDRIELN